jgi:hypothetical protein
MKENTDLAPASFPVAASNLAPLPQDVKLEFKRAHKVLFSH